MVTPFRRITLAGGRDVRVRLTIRDFSRSGAGRRAGAGFLMAAVTAALVAGCGGHGDGSRTADTKLSPQVRDRLAAVAGLGQGASVIVTASAASVDIYDSPTDTKAASSMASPNENGVSRVFLVQAKLPGWWQVLLPVQPNGRTGWLRAAQVRASETPYRIVVSRGRHLLQLYNDGAQVAQVPVAIGTSDTPTPGGRFYLTELLRPPDPSGIYGPYAFGLSGYSTSMSSFDGHQPVIGIHGTNDPALLGQDVSHGCIRLSNDAITHLAQTVPLGTPVDIVV
ncbi:L,D-TPase catalytic domain-containing protein [Frankia sp. AgKG'84/4]|nr:L,D-transpeptidase [Frankia sp. AgKG'84/4]